MVLNNDKWDRKAKRNYMIKHGIKPPTTNTKPKLKKHFVQNEFDEQLQSSSSEEVEEFPVLQEDKHQLQKSSSNPVPTESEGVEEEDDEEAVAEDLDSNAWRYKDLPPDDDDDYFPLINQIRPKTDDFKDLKPTKKMDKISTNELLSLKIGKNVPRNIEKDSKNSHIRILNEQERKEFFEIQEKANKMKHYHEIKLKFSDEQEKFKKRQKQNKVLDLTDKDSYNDKVLAQFIKSQRQTKNRITEEEFDEDLGDLLGDKLLKETSKQAKDVDDLLSEIDKLSIPQTSKGHSEAIDSATPISYKPTEEDESFLDELL